MDTKTEKNNTLIIYIGRDKEYFRKIKAILETYVPINDISVELFTFESYLALVNLNTKNKNTIIISPEIENCQKILEHYLNQNHYNYPVIIDSNPTYCADTLERTRTTQGSLLAYQNFLFDIEKFKNSAGKNFNTARLSEIDEQIIYYEPEFRLANITVFNLNAVKFSDSPASENPQPAGLNITQIAKLSYFAGIAHVPFNIITGIDVTTDPVMITAKVISQMIWYNLRAYSEYSEQKNSEKEIFYIADTNEDLNNIDIKFICNTYNNLWEIEIANKNTKRIFPCAYTDFEAIKQNKITDRIQNYIDRLQNF